MRSGAASDADTIPAVPRVEPVEGSEAGLAKAETLRRMAAARNYNKWLFDRLRPYLGLRVLDVGAGLGTFCELIAPWCDLVVALESDPIFAAALRDRFADSHRVRVVEAEAEVVDPSSLPGPFDSIVCLNVLEHIRDDTAALRRFHDLLAPGGRLLLLVPAHQVLYGRIGSLATSAGTRSGCCSAFSSRAVSPWRWLATRTRSEQPDGLCPGGCCGGRTSPPARSAPTIAPSPCYARSIASSCPSASRSGSWGGGPPTKGRS